ncbi:hypothetical protein [Marinobacter salexigens]|uniref:hypothetical protein n=1 Tax=Marinobacter salexigens TaxID=1925763 RepID=UPI001877B6A1|nr:hypothetical protein [Marinobacter salexigens]
MVTADIRAEKKEEMDQLFLLSCDLWDARHYEESARIGTKLHGFKDAFLGFDTDLYKYGCKLISLFSQFMVSDCKTFEAFAMLKACQAFKGLKLDPVLDFDLPLPQVEYSSELHNSSYYFRLSSEFREDRGYSGGFVIIFDEVVSGWMDELRNPERWEPGCIAIDQFGNQWQAYGGDSYHGAKHWIPLVSADLVQEVS